MGCLRDIQERAFTIAESKGFHEGHRSVGESLLLITTEVAEAAEDLRDNRWVTTFREDGKPEGFPSELADIIIRTAHLAQELGIDLESEVRIKMDYNETRPFKHGGKQI